MSSRHPIPTPHPHTTLAVPLLAAETMENLGIRVEHQFKGPSGVVLVLRCERRSRKLLCNENLSERRGALILSFASFMATFDRAVKREA